MQAGRAVRDALEDAAAALADAPCIFWACPGSDEPFEDMKTCRVCAAAQEVRIAMAKLDEAMSA